MPIRAMLPPADSNAYWPGESLSTDKRTVWASKPNGPRKLKSTVLDDVTVARVTIRNCLRYDWMLARRALHSGNGWLICKVFCKSIRIRFSETNLSNSDAIACPEGKPEPIWANCVHFLYNLVSAQDANVFSRLEHKSPVHGEFRQVFP